MYWLQQTFSLRAFYARNAALIVLTAALYFVAARVSQIFAIDPGNITPVWIPSGIMLALALQYGARIWPGVFIGAFLGNVWAYLSFEPISETLKAFASGALNGIGDVLSVVLIALVIKRLTQNSSPFETLNGFLVFGVVGAIIGPFISALFGVTGLYLFGFIEQAQYVTALSTWWVGDGVGVLLFTPLLLSVIGREHALSPHFFPVLLFCVVVFGAATATLFSLIPPFVWLIALWVLLVPVAFVAMLYAGQRLVFIVQVVISSIAIMSTYLGKGPFVAFELLTPLMSLQLFVGMFSCVLFALAVVVNQKQSMTEALQAQQQRLESLYRHDALTGLWNRYRIEEFLGLEIKKLKRESNLFAVLLIDIDYFKSINDEHGHLVGDDILKELSRLIDQQIRESDLFGRWGGEEFIIVASESSVADAESLAEKLVNLVAQHDFGLPRPVTISIGLSMSRPEDTSVSIVQRADRALYKAKNSGKNQFATEA